MEARHCFPVSPPTRIVVSVAKFCELMLFLKARAQRPLACKCDGGRSGDDNNVNGCPKTFAKEYAYFVPWASVGRARDQHFYIGTIPARTGHAKHAGYIHSNGRKDLCLLLGRVREAGRELIYKNPNVQLKDYTVKNGTWNNLEHAKNIKNA